MAPKVAATSTPADIKLEKPALAMAKGEWATSDVFIESEKKAGYTHDPKVLKDCIELVHNITKPERQPPGNKDKQLSGAISLLVELGNAVSDLDKRIQSSKDTYKYFADSSP